MDKCDIIELFILFSIVDSKASVHFLTIGLNEYEGSIMVEVDIDKVSLPNPFGLGNKNFGLVLLKNKKT